MSRGIAGASKQASEVQAVLGRPTDRSTTAHTNVKYHHAVSPSHQARTTERLHTGYTMPHHYNHHIPSNKILTTQTNTTTTYLTTRF